MKLAVTTLVFCVASLLALGMVMLYSASMEQAGARYLAMQLIWCAAGLAACVVATSFDYRLLKKVWPLLLGGAIVMLVLVLESIRPIYLFWGYYGLYILTRWFVGMDRFLALLLVGLTFLLASFAANNSEVWMHLATGRWIAEGNWAYGVDPFSFATERIEQDQIQCFIGYTSYRLHQTIRDNLHQSPLYSGKIKGIGPRYCPSIAIRIPSPARPHGRPAPCGREIPRWRFCRRWCTGWTARACRR